VNINECVETKMDRDVRRSCSQNSTTAPTPSTGTNLEIARIEVAKAGCIQTWSHVTLVVFEDGRTVTCKRRAK
jgi:hypothetical protein